MRPRDIIDQLEGLKEFVINYDDIDGWDPKSIEAIDAAIILIRDYEKQQPTMGDTGIRHAGTIYGHSGPCGEKCWVNDIPMTAGEKMSAVEALSDRLYYKTRLLSSINKMTQMDEFLKLVQLGQTTVQFILREMWLGQIRMFWFPLLRTITGENPVPGDDRGNVEAMRSCWVVWGQDHGFYQNGFL